nr:tankyrase-1-like [Halyomorpha halys]
MRFHKAAKDLDDTRIVDLCAEGVDPNVADINNNGYTPLHLAASKGISTLIALARCSANLNAKDFDGNTPLHIAVIKDYFWSADILLILGANPNVKNNEGKIPQDLVTSDKNKNFQLTFKPEWMKWISDVRSLSDREKKLLTSVKNGHYGDIATSCEDGVDVRVKDANNKQYTMLHYAVTIKSNTPSVIQMLLRCGADINARDADGNTPLHIAILENYEESQRILLFNGADPYLANGAGKTAYQMLKESLPAGDTALDRLHWYMNSMPV